MQNNTASNEDRATAEINDDRFDLNTATEEELLDVSFIGEKRTKALLSRREHHGAFKNWRDVENIPGFSKVMVSALKDRCYIKTEENKKQSSED